MKLLNHEDWQYSVHREDGISEENEAKIRNKATKQIHELSNH